MAATPPVPAPETDLVPSWLHRLASIGWRILAIAGLLVLVIALAIKLASVTASILVGLLICATFGPYAEALRRRGWSKTRTAALITLLAIAVFVGAIVLIVLAVLPAVSDILAAVERGLGQAGEWLVSIGVSSDLVATLERLDDGLASWLASSALGVLGSAISVITVAVLGGFLTFYFLQDGDSAWRVATQGLPEARRERASAAAKVAMWSAGGYLRRTAVRATLRAVVMGIVLAMLGVPQAGALAVIVFFGGFVPYLGSLFTTSIVLLAALVAVGTGAALLVLLAVVLLVLFDGRIPALRVDPTGVQIDPGVVIVALPAGAALAGVPGMIMAVPTVAVMVALTGTVVDVLEARPRGAPAVQTDPEVPIWLDRAAQWAWRLLVGAALIGVVIALASLVPNIIAPILVAVTLASTFLPASRALEARGFSRTRAAATVSVVLWAVVGIVILQSLAALAGPASNALQGAITGGGLVGTHLPSEVSALPGQVISDIAATIRDAVLAILGSIVGGAIFLILSALLAFYMLKDGDRAWAAVSGRLAGWRRREIDIAAHESVAKLGGYMVATGSLGLFNAVTGYVIMVVLGLPLALPVAVLSFFGGFIPYIGQATMSLIGFLIAFAFGSPQDILIMAVYSAAMNIVQGSVLAPLVYGRAVSLHPAVVLVAIPAGGTLAGILGMFLAVPILGIAAGVWPHVLAAMGSEDPQLSPATREAVPPPIAAVTPVPGPAPGA